MILLPQPLECWGVHHGRPPSTRSTRLTRTGWGRHPGRRSLPLQEPVAASQSPPGGASHPLPLDGPDSVFSPAGDAAPVSTERETEAGPSTPQQSRLFPDCPRPGPLQTPPRASLPPRPRAGLLPRLQAMVALDDPDGGLEATPGAETRL